MPPDYFDLRCTIRLQAVDYEADEHATTAADEVVEEITAAGEEPAADSVLVEAAQKGVVV